MTLTPVNLEGLYKLIEENECSYKIKIANLRKKNLKSETKVFFLKSKMWDILDVLKSSSCILIDCINSDIECWQCKEDRIKQIINEALSDAQLVKD